MNISNYDRFAIAFTDVLLMLLPMIICSAKIKNFIWAWIVGTSIALALDFGYWTLIFKLVRDGVLK